MDYNMSDDTQDAFDFMFANADAILHEDVVDFDLLVQNDYHMGDNTQDAVDYMLANSEAILHEDNVDFDLSVHNDYHIGDNTQDAFDYMFANADEILQQDAAQFGLDNDEAMPMDPQTGGGESLPDLTGLFKLVKTSERLYKRFNSLEYRYMVKLAPLPRVFSPEESMAVMPQIIANIMDLCFENFDGTDRITVSLSCSTLTEPIYLRMQKLSAFTVDALMRRIAILNSQKKLVVDESFAIRIFRTELPRGGATRRKHQHVARDNKRFKKSIVSVCVDDNLCLPAALYLGKFRLTHDVADKDRTKWKNLCHRNRAGGLARHARDVLIECDLECGRKCDMEDLQILQENAFPEFQIKVISANHGNTVIRRVPEVKEVGMQEMYILLDDEHFDLVTSPTGFHCSPYYCEFCDRPYCAKERHRCSGKCDKCYRYKDECTGGTFIRCIDCSRTFNNQDCFNVHKEMRQNGTSYCERLFFCKKCDVFVNMLRRKKTAKHECGEMHCKTCRGFFKQADHLCYLQKLPLPDAESEVLQYLFFDYETYNDPVLGHMPACVVAQYSDGQEFQFPAPGEPMTKDVGEQFGRWLFSEQHRGYTIVAHNFRGYDGHFILKYLLDNKLKGVNVIKRGNQLLEIRYQSLNIRSRDTLNFLPMKLAALPKAVGLDITIEKGDFPHRLNHPGNWDKVLPWPEPEMYMIDGLTKEKREEFLKWHTEAKAAANDVFIFRKELMEYCLKDVEILRRSTLKFCDNFSALTALNPLKSVTVPAACHRYFRTFLLQSDEIAILSTHGPHRNRRSSFECLQWLEWENMSANGRIRHAGNGHEVRIGRYFVDGIDETTKTVYEYNGCVFHGCPKCTEPGDFVPYEKKTMREAHEEFQERVQFFQSQGYAVEVKWSHEWLEERKDPFIAGFLLLLNRHEPLNPRDAFKGGRTNASRLYYETMPDEKILHLDVVSLYPLVNSTKDYPSGHPAIIVSNIGDVKDYYGLIKCKVLPPAQCLYPVLPCTVNGKLVFTLCRTCAVAKSTVFCTHSDDERCLEGTWVTPELHHALDVGYQVVEISEVWHWERKKSGIFAEYMKKFLKIKIQANGWPAWCDSAEKRNEYVQQVKDREGIELDPADIRSDPGMKSAAKLCLNSLWGKFGQRDDFCTTKFVTDAKKYLDLLLSKSVEIHDVYGVNEDCLMVTYSKNEEYNEGNNSSNLAIAAFTTAHARLILLDMMEKLGPRLLYFDTDSVIFVQGPDDWLPPTGTALGDWDTQLEAGESHIVKFVSCGPKVYSYQTDTGRIELKVKGMTQNGYTEDIMDWNNVSKSFERTGRALDFDQLKRLLDGSDNNVQVLYPEYIKRNGKTQEINTVHLYKKLKLVYDKRMLFPDFTTLPFGTKAC